MTRGHLTGCVRYPKFATFGTNCTLTKQSPGRETAPGLFRGRLSPMQISIKSDLKRVSKTLSRVQRKQIPFAASNALNDTAFDVQRTEKQEAPRRLDRPTRFTISGFRVRKSSKRTLHARVFIPPTQWGYMRYAVEGGTAPGTSNVPVNAPLNQYGSMRRNYLRNQLSRKDVFSGKPRGHHGAPAGVWQRIGRSGGQRKGSFKGRASLKLLAAYKTGVNYRARFPFGPIAERRIRQVFTGNMRRQLRRALATAK